MFRIVFPQAFALSRRRDINAIMFNSSGIAVTNNSVGVQPDFLSLKLIIHCTPNLSRSEPK